MQNIKIILEYDGTRYDGWQKQGNTDRTIQGKLEEILKKMTGDSVEVHGAGRTDAGVHALGQTANFHISEEYSPGEVKEYLNRYLPEDIAVLQAEKVGERFHSRLNAAKKTYRYTIETDAKKGVFERKYVYGLGKDLDMASVQKAMGALKGEHDFKSFCANKKMKKSTVREIFEAKAERKGSKIVFSFTGNGFLYHMVRIMAGTLIEIGQGKRSPQEIINILNAGNREAAGFTAPPEGLFLVNVEYPEE